MQVGSRFFSLKNNGNLKKSILHPASSRTKTALEQSIICLKVCELLEDLVKKLPVLKMPSGMKNAPTVMPTSSRNLKNQKLRGKKLKLFKVCAEIQS